MNNLVDATRKKFSFAWTVVAKDEVKKGWYKDSFAYLNHIPKKIFSGSEKLGLDGGCGSGSDMLNIGRYGARIIGIDISDAVKTTYSNVASLDRLHVAKADIYNLPFKDEMFDFVYSFGVLHHLPDPEKGFRILTSKVKKGGTVIIYVYEDFSERSPFERILLSMVNSLRTVTKRMSPRTLYVLSIILSPFVLLFCSMPYQILKRIPLTRFFAERIPYRHTARLDCIAADLYDRFSPPIEHRYKKDDVEKWFKKANFNDVHILNYRGWVAWGRKG